MPPLSFQLTGRSASTRARTGSVTTPHGTFATPAFMPVGTKGAMKGVFPHQLRGLGAEVCLNNTYHLLLRPGADLIARRGGVQLFMNWDGPILTDSGGYQAYSMADINAVDEEGVTFKSIISGDMIRLTPERATEVQNQLGADIIMALDDCPPSVDPAAAPVNQVRLRHAALRDAMHKAGYDHEARLDLSLDRTTRWLERCIGAHQRPQEQALFGIVQGGTDPERRSRAASEITRFDLPGFAIGGVAVGESAGDIARIVTHTAPLLPEEKPRYLMGVGYPRDLVAAVRAGVDMFDCVLPARNGRNANAFLTGVTGEGSQIRLRNARFAEDDGPLEAGCDCPACDPARFGWQTHGGRPFTRAYIRHLFLAEEMLGPMLVSLHNLRHFLRLMEDLRGTIGTDDWGGLAGRWPAAMGVGGAAALGNGGSKTPSEPA